MERPFICIAGKNNIAVDVLKAIIDKYGTDNVCIVCNKTETGENGFQRSLRQYAKMINVPEKSLKDIYAIKNLVFLSLEFDRIVNPQRFIDARLYNIHFSLLPQYKGMYTSAHPILNGEKYSGVTFHCIDSGIDTGKIIDQEKFEIGDSDCRELYLKYIKYGTLVVLRNLENVIYNRITGIDQPSDNSTYYSKESLDYEKLDVDLHQTANGIQRQLRAFSFREYQLPIIYGKRISDSRILSSRSTGKAGTVLYQTDDYMVLNTVDYNIVLLCDRFDDFIYACTCGDLEKVKRICACGTKIVNEKNSQGWSPLMVATYNNQIEIVNYLISIGADVRATNRNGTNMLMYAKEAYKRSGSNALFKLFVQLGLDINAKDYGDRDLFSYLVDDGLSMEELLK